MAIKFRAVDDHICVHLICRKKTRAGAWKQLLAVGLCGVQQTVDMQGPQSVIQQFIFLVLGNVVSHLPFHMFAAMNTNVQHSAEDGK